MFTVLKIICCIIAALCVAAVIPLGAIFGWAVCVSVLAGAVIFGALTFWLKDGNPFTKKEERKPDFMNSEKENEKIRQELCEKDDETD